MKIFLVGYMGVGKTTLGKRLANKLGVAFADLDTEIEKRMGENIPSIFQSRGEGEFRKLESEILQVFCERSENFVLSTGGGAPVSPGNLEVMKEAGLVIWLDMPVGGILSRLKQNQDSRPLISGLPEEELKAFVEKHLRERIPYYEKAHIRFEASSVNSENLNDLAEKIQSRYTR